MPARVDHFAIAVRSIDEALGFFGRFLPIRPHAAPQPGWSDDFRWCDFFLGHVKVELIESARPGSFVERFLERRGEGLHHVTLDVTDFDDRLARMEAAGLRIVDRWEAGTDRTAFVHPKTAHGMLIQMWDVPVLSEPETTTVVPFPGGHARLRFDHLSAAVHDLAAGRDFVHRWLPITGEAPAHRGYAGDFDLQQFDAGPFRLELIADASGSSFVRRFLVRRGEGFHHLSLDVDDLDAVLEPMRAAGVRIVDEAEVGGGYRTAFVSPRSAHGVLIQFWQVPDVEVRNWGG
jgi:methylmalonyl-CoA epimerase